MNDTKPNYTSQATTMYGPVQADHIENYSPYFHLPAVEDPYSPYPPPPPAPTDRTKAPPPCGWLPRRRRMRYHSLGKIFVGKRDELWAIHAVLQQGGTAVVEGVGVVTGIGGIGKTQLAIEYVHRFAMCYPGGIFWVDAERGKLGQVSQVLEGAPDIAVDTKLDEDCQLQELWRALVGGEPVLLVLDNFAPGEPLRDRLPPAGPVHTLVTTRRRDLGYHPIALATMTPEEGLRLLNTGARRFGDEALPLVAVLGGLPLALELSRHYLYIYKGVRVDELIQAITAVGEIEALHKFADMYQDELPTGHVKQIARTIEISWALAADDTRRLLQAVALLAPVPVPVRLLRRLTGGDPAHVLEDPLAASLHEAGSRLALVDRDAAGDPVMHRLIVGYIRLTLDASDALYREVVDAVVAEMARVTDDHDTIAYEELVKIVPHAEALIEARFTGAEQAVDLASYVRWHYRKWGRFRLAEKFGRLALAAAQTQLDSDNEKIAMCQSNLALVLRDLGELSEARELLRAALASAEKRFAPGHPSIAIGQSNLALVLRDLGELSEARALIARAYHSLLEKFGPDHPHTQIVRQHYETLHRKNSGPESG